MRKNFFVDLMLPYSVVHGEQIEIKAVLHNYQSDPVTVSQSVMILVVGKFVDFLILFVLPMV